MDKQQQVRDFLETKVKEKGFSLNALSLQLGKNSTYLFHFVKRHSPRRLDETSRRRLAQILDVSEQELCDFPLPTALIQDKFSTLTNLFGLGKDKEADLIKLDVIDMTGLHTNRLDQLKSNVIGQELMSPQVFSSYTNADSKHIKLLKAAGDAMSPTVNAGDILWLDTSYSLPTADGIYLINTNGDCILRRIQINPFDNSIEVSADNSAYKSYIIRDYKTLNLCGRILLTTHKLS
jgi:hypothetical protein